jgi:hypothetical protein
MVWFNGKKNINWVEGFCLVMGVVFIFSVALILDSSNQAFAQKDKKDKPELNVFNPVGTPIGAVDDEGNIYNPVHKLIGSVDGSGTVYSIFKKPIGKIDARGQVFNRIGKLTGSVDDEGNVFNNNGRKVGSVKSPSPGNIMLIGGAAWLLLLGVR